jgi:hypothetical protein
MPEKIIKKFQDEYGKEKGKSVYYATARKQKRNPETFKKKKKKNEGYLVIDGFKKFLREKTNYLERDRIENERERFGITKTDLPVITKFGATYNIKYPNGQTDTLWDINRVSSAIMDNYTSFNCSTRVDEGTMENLLSLQSKALKFVKLLNQQRRG